MLGGDNSGEGGMWGGADTLMEWLNTHTLQEICRRGTNLSEQCHAPEYLKEIHMDKKKEHKGKRTTWRSALRTNKERSGRAQDCCVPSRGASDSQRCCDGKGGVAGEKNVPPPPLPPPLPPPPPHHVISGGIIAPSQSSPPMLASRR